MAIINRKYPAITFPDVYSNDFRHAFPLKNNEKIISIVVLSQDEYHSILSMRRDTASNKEKQKRQMLPVQAKAQERSSFETKLTS